MALATLANENVHYPFPMPKTITAMVEVKMPEKKVTQVKLARMLNIGAAKLSQILNGRRKPNVLC